MVLNHAFKFEEMIQDGIRKDGLFSTGTISTISENSNLFSVKI